MKVSVCASITYIYETEIDDALCRTDEDGTLCNEASFLRKVEAADPAKILGVDNSVGYIVSVYSDKDEELYIGG